MCDGEGVRVCDGEGVWYVIVWCVMVRVCGV